MAATSTNKQPLLVDRVLHYVVDLKSALVTSIDVGGTNTAALIVDSTQQDGAIIEDIYSISRDTIPYGIALYLSSAPDYLRPNEGVFIGIFQSGTLYGEVTSWGSMPRILAPMPQTGTDVQQFRALYIPKGKALWAAMIGDKTEDNGPLLGCQGGWY